MTERRCQATIDVGLEHGDIVPDLVRCVLLPGHAGTHVGFYAWSDDD